MVLILYEMHCTSISFEICLKISGNLKILLPHILKFLTLTFKDQGKIYIFGARCAKVLF